MLVFNLSGISIVYLQKKCFKSKQLIQWGREERALAVSCCWFQTSLTFSHPSYGCMYLEALCCGVKACSLPGGEFKAPCAPALHSAACCLPCPPLPVWDGPWQPCASMSQCGERPGAELKGSSLQQAQLSAGKWVWEEIRVVQSAKAASFWMSVYSSQGLCNLSKTA